MKTSKKINKPTYFSKILAMIFFIALPFIGFYLGMKYQGILELQEKYQYCYENCIQSKNEFIKELITSKNSNKKIFIK